MSSARVIARSFEERELEKSDLRGSSLGESGQRTVLDHDELTIVEMLLAGNRHGAIAACARVHGAAIGRLCFLLLGAQSEADEAAQETMLAAYHAAPSYRGEGTARATAVSPGGIACIASRTPRNRSAASTAAGSPSFLSGG